MIMLIHHLRNCIKSLTLKLKNSSSRSSVVRSREGNAKFGTIGRGVAFVGIDEGEAHPCIRLIMCRANNCNKELIELRIRGEAPPVLVIIGGNKTSGGSV